MHIMEALGTSSARASELQLLMRTGLGAAEVWPVAADILARAPLLGPEFMTLDEAYLEVLARRMQLWMVNTPERFTGAMLTDIKEAHNGAVVRLRWMAGEDMINFLPFLDVVEHWAYGEGARWSCVVECRRGFERVLRPYGYSNQAVTLVKHLIAATEH